MREVDKYDLDTAAREVRGRSVETAIAAHINATWEATHFPANGARVVTVYLDEGDQQIKSEDYPVLWFDADYRAVVALGQETGTFAERLEDEFCVVYHPDARSNPDGRDPCAFATAVAISALTDYLASKAQHEEKK